MEPTNRDIRAFLEESYSEFLDFILHSAYEGTVAEYLAEQADNFNEFMQSGGAL